MVMGRNKKLQSTKAKSHKSKEEQAAAAAVEEKMHEFTPLDVSVVPSSLREVEEDPPSIAELAEAEWQRIVPLLQELPISELDRQAVINYCNYTAIHQDSARIVAEEGAAPNGKESGAFKAMVRAEGVLKSLRSSLGLDIKSRLSILSNQTPNGVEEEDDPFAGFKKGGK